MPAAEIITDLPREFLDEFREEVMGTIPQEKVQAELRQVAIGRVLASEGALAVGGLGQKLGEVDPRTFFRWQAQYPRCWEDREFVREFFKDNPRLKSKGWEAKASNLRHSITFSGGTATSNLKTL